MRREAGVSNGLWTEVDRYFARTVAGTDAALDSAVSESRRAGLPEIQVAANQGKLLMMLCRAVGARRVLELGTLGGYSTIWLARGLSAGGTVVTLEIDAKHAAVARDNIERAGLSASVEVREGPALAGLERLAAEGSTPFDFVFIDADKERIPEYFEWAVRLSRPGAMIVVDNVVRDGKVVDAQSQDASVKGVRRLFETVGRDPRVTVSALQTVGEKGYDGALVALVNGG